MIPHLIYITNEYKHNNNSISYKRGLSVHTRALALIRTREYILCNKKMSMEYSLSTQQQRNVIMSFLLHIIPRLLMGLCWRWYSRRARWQKLLAIAIVAQHTTARRSSRLLLQSE
jgi:hypothetical protein